MADLTRRGFLKMLGMAAPVAVAPTYFFAPIGGWKSDLIAQPMGLDGIPWWGATSNSGIWAGIDRAAYPGRLSTPTIECSALQDRINQCLSLLTKHYELAEFEHRYG